ncbi:MAG: T9SS type A sorting domain-containing protein, partial [Candidatus Halalkalibacterium sp. M3_1C_030]
DFSENLPLASFRVRPVSNATVNPVSISNVPVPNETTFISRDDTYRNEHPMGLSIYSAQTDTFLVIPSSESAYALQLNSNDDTYFDFGVSTPQQSFNGSRLVLANAPSGESDIELSAWSWDGSSWQNEWQAVSAPNRGFLSSANGDTLLIDFTQDRLLVDNGTGLPDLSEPEQSSVTVNGKRSVLTPGNLSVNGESFSLTPQANNRRLYTGALQIEPGESSFYLLSSSTFSIIDSRDSDPFKEIANAPFLEWPALVDFNNDQRLDILYTDGDGLQLFGKNFTGAMLKNFPINAPQGSRFVGTPLVADLDGDEIQDLIMTVQDSVSMNIYTYDSEGNQKENFPLYVGSVQKSDLEPIHPVIFNQNLYAVSHLGELKAWNFPQMQDVLWNSRYGNEAFNKITGRISGTELPGLPSSILVEEETYNWPNPASEVTHIRYLLREAGRVDIKIITQGGRILYDESFDARGSIPEEQQIDTANWGSGVYFALVTATVDGQEARKMIKIAVIH